MERFVKVLCVMLLPLLMFFSCKSNDEGSSSVKSSLVGAWKTSIDSSPWKSIKINPNGKMRYGYVTKAALEKYTYNSETGTYIYSWDNCSVEYDPSDNAFWTYNETTQTISMYREDGYYSFTYKVTMSDDKNSWVGVDAKGKTYTFIRIEE